MDYGMFPSFNVSPSGGSNIEPMHIGSAQNSPVSATVARPGGTYVQPFLFGLHNQSSQSFGPTERVYGNSPMSESFQHKVFSPVKPKQHVQFSIAEQSKSRTAGPPVSSISFDKHHRDMFGSFNSGSDVLAPPVLGNVSSFEESPQQRCTWKSDNVSDICVTIFGFTPDSASYILQQFSQYGTIVQFEMAKKGNWLHIQYQSRLEAQAALSKNGKVFNSHIRVGVVPCTDEEIVARFSRSKNDTELSGHPLWNQTGLASSHNSFLSESVADCSTRSNMRNLLHTTSPMVPVEANTPHKNVGVVSTVLGYLFGW